METTSTNTKCLTLTNDELHNINFFLICQRNELIHDLNICKSELTRKALKEDIKQIEKLITKSSKLIKL